MSLSLEFCKRLEKLGLPQNEGEYFIELLQGSPTYYKCDMEDIPVACEATLSPDLEQVQKFAMVLAEKRNLKSDHHLCFLQFKSFGENLHSAYEIWYDGNRNRCGTGSKDHETRILAACHLIFKMAEEDGK